jgi:hypothetical protein
VLAETNSGGENQADWHLFSLPSNDAVLVDNAVRVSFNETRSPHQFDHNLLVTFGNPQFSNLIGNQSWPAKFP